jgi:hypothetical protein
VSDDRTEAIAGSPPSPPTASASRARVTEPSPDGVSPQIFPALAFLYGPADRGTRAQVVEQPEGWSAGVRADPDAEVILWGRMPARGRPSAGQAVRAMRRELALVRLCARPPAGFHVAAVHRLPPVRRPGRIRMAIRSATMCGLVVELIRDRRPRRVIDEVVRAAGATGRPRLRPSGDGSALARLHRADGRPVELRVARTGHRKDPRRGRAALLTLEAAGVPCVPRAVDVGQTAGATWATESVVAGDHARELSRALLDEVVQLCARLPEMPGPPTSIRDHLREVGEVFPHHADALADIGGAATRWTGDLPAVLLHGDMWLNNLLVADGRLTGLIDWDTWHPGGVPGADLLSLVAAEVRTRFRQDVGELLVDGFWERGSMETVLHPYFRARGLPDPDRAGRASIAVAWWAGRIAGALGRVARPADDPSWVARNVDEPVHYLTRLAERLG